MATIEVGTASWTDKTLIESGWYPKTADTPEKRLAYYAEQFPVVEVACVETSVLVRDSRNPDGEILEITPGQWSAFLRGVRDADELGRR